VRSFEEKPLSVKTERGFFNLKMILKILDRKVGSCYNRERFSK